MNQRIRVLQKLGEEFERAVAQAPDTREWRRSGARSRIGQILRTIPAAIMPALAAIVAIAVVLGAVLLVRPAHHHPLATTPSASASERSLVAQYAVLRRAQTTADRLEAGPAPGMNRSRQFGSGGGSSGSSHYRVRITGLAGYRNVPSFTRVATVDRVRVSFFVEYQPITRALPKASVTGNDPQAAAKETTLQHLRLLQRLWNARAGYSLWARIGRDGSAQLIAPSPNAVAGRSPGNGGRATPSAAQVDPLWAVRTASLPGPSGTIVAVVPDGIARLSWTWPREFDSQALSYQPKVTIAATVHDNVAVAAAPARFASSEQIDPETVVRYAADGRMLARLTNPSNSANVYQGTTYSSTPGPETPQSRRAERYPATPNRVVIAPNVASASSARQFYFHVLLNNRTYFLRVTGGPHPGCIKPNPQDPTGPGYGEVLHPGAEATVRGDTYLDNSPPGIIGCPGTYRLSVSVLNNHNQPYLPFGSATFAIDHTPYAGGTATNGATGAGSAFCQQNPGACSNVRR